MALSNTVRIHTLLQRELQEYRNSLVITPMAVGALLLFLMLLSVVFAGRLANLGEGAMELLLEEGDGAGVNISISIDDGGDTVIVRGDALPTDGGAVDPDAGPLQDLQVVEEVAPLDETEWDFSREWNYQPLKRDKHVSGGQHEHALDSINPVLNVLHSFFLFLMFILSINYLLGCLYQDRKDRSILFWKSMPVSEWQEVLSKLAVATIVVPLIYFAASLVTQLLAALIAMLMVWRMDGQPYAAVLGNIQFLPLILNQLGGLLVWALWIVPAYAWFMLASAAARRSPFLLAFGVPLALVFIESVFVGSDWVMFAIANHLPHMIDGNDADSLGFYVYGPVWDMLDYPGMVLGLGFAALAVSGAVWLRRHRFEL